MTSRADAPGLLRRRATAQPDGVALVVDGQEELRFGEWDRRSTRVARGLREAGVAAGDRIALAFGGLDWVEYAIGYFGVLKAGATAVHLSTALPARERRRRLAQTGAARVVEAPDVAAVERGGRARSGPRPAPGDVAEILYTSGTTGPAKAYAVPHGNLAFDRRLGDMDAFAGAQHMIVTVPLGTGSSAGVVNVATVSPFVAVLCPPGDVERLGQLVERFQAGMVGITPWVATQIAEARLHERYDLSSVHTFACGSAPLPPAHARALLAMVPGARVSSACSQSEAAPALVVNVFDPLHPTRAGRPAPNTELRIAGPGGRPLPPGGLGEIWLRSPAPKRLYLDRPAANRRILRDGWYRTGDLGRVDGDGWLHFFDRRADAIRTADGLVSSLAVEAELCEHPAVREAAAFGIGVRGREQEVAAAVVLRPGGDPAEVRDRLGGHVVAVDALPRNLHGKVLKRRLRAQVGARLGFVPA